MLVKDPRSGKFITQPDSYAAKNISYRLSKDSDRKFRQLCESLGKTPGELSRQIIESWLSVNS